MRRCSIWYNDKGSCISGMGRIRQAGSRAIASASLSDPTDDIVTIGGSGFGIMAIIVATEEAMDHPRRSALARLASMLDLLERATCYHGHFPAFHEWLHRRNKPFSRKDDGGDIVETSLLFQGLICARQYFDHDTPAEARLRDRMTWLWRDVEWSWHRRDGRSVLTWHWSPNNGFASPIEIRGWNECLLTYVLAASSPLYAIKPKVYHEGWAQGQDFLNGHATMASNCRSDRLMAGRCSFCHYSFSGLDPRGL